MQEKKSVGFQIPGQKYGLGYRHQGASALALGKIQS
jgi:hypothetical protein